MNWPVWLRPRLAPSDSCTSLQLPLSLYADRMASPAEARRVEAHLAGCESCRRTLRWMQATRRAVSQRPAALPPADLRASVLRAIAALETPPAAPMRRPLVLRPAFAAGMLALVVAGFTGHALLTRPPVSPVPVSPMPPFVAVVPPRAHALPAAVRPILTAVRPATEHDETLAARPSSKSRPHPALLARQPVPEPAVLDNVPHSPLPVAPRSVAPRSLPRLARAVPAPPFAPVKQTAPSLPEKEASLPPPSPAPAAPNTSSPAPETHPAPVTLVASSAMHDDGLSSVRLLATSLQKSGLARQSNRDGEVSARTASYNALASDGKFVQVDMVHTP